MSQILMTDDSSSQGIILSGIPEQLGHTVDTDGNGQEALKKIEMPPKDGMVLDYLMPIRDGLQTLEALKAGNITLTIIMLLADIQEWLITRCLEPRAIKYSNKPIKHTQLQELLQHILPVSETMEVPCR